MDPILCIPEQSSSELQQALSISCSASVGFYHVIGTENASVWQFLGKGQKMNWVSVTLKEVLLLNNAS